MPPQHSQDQYSLITATADTTGSVIQSPTPTLTPCPESRLHVNSCRCLRPSPPHWPCVSQVSEMRRVELAHLCPSCRCSPPHHTQLSTAAAAGYPIQFHHGCCRKTERSIDLVRHLLIVKGELGFVKKKSFPP